MAKVLVPSASHLLTDHMLSSEGTFCYTLFKELEKFGYHFEAISAQVEVKKPLKNATLHQTGFFRFSPEMNPFRKYLAHMLFMIGSYKKSTEIIGRNKIEIIHHMLPAVYNQTFSPIIISTRTDKYPKIFGPISAHVYQRPLDERLLLNTTSKIHKKTIEKCDVIVTITEQVKNLYLKVLDEEKIWVIPFAVDTNIFKPAKECWRKEFYEILFAGYLYKIKGVYYLIRAMRIISEKRDDVKLIIVGDGPERNSLMKFAEDLRIKDKVFFTGMVPYMDMPKYYQRCDVFCLPTLGEPFGKVLIEAMACAKPVISSNIGGPSEIIEDGKNGFLVSPAKPEAIAERILTILEDEYTRRKMGENARKTAVEKYSWEKVSQKYNYLYRSIC